MKVSPKRRYEMTERAESARATGEAILKATEKAVFEKYYEDVTLADIAAEAGVTVRTVLRRFESKEGLFDAVNDDLGSRMSEMVGLPVGQPEVALKATLDRYEWSGDANYRLLAQEDRHPPIARACEMGRTGQRAWVEEVFESYLPASGEARERRMLQILLILDVYAWRLMRREQGASRETTEAALAELLDLIVSLEREDQEP